MLKWIDNTRPDWFDGHPNFFPGAVVFAIGLFAGAALFIVPAHSQQAPPDPIVASYAQLLGEANARVANLNGALQQANTKIVDLQKQIDTAKPKIEPTK